MRLNRYAWRSTENSRALRRSCAPSRRRSSRAQKCRRREAHYKTPEFVQTGGYYEKAPTIPKGQLKRHLEVQRKAWADLPANARAVATQALTGQLVDPGIGNADNFASTTIYYKQKYGRKPDLAEWRAFTEAVGRSKGRWIGDVPGLDQTRTLSSCPHEAIKIPAGAIRVTP